MRFVSLLPPYGERAVRRAFFAGLGLVYLSAFASLGVQVTGLVGEHGVLPIGETIENARAYGERGGQLGDVRHALPTFCWFDASDASLRLQCFAGGALAVLLVLGVAPMLVLPGLWALYLSLTVAGQDFLGFQWDALLLEAGFFAIWFAPWGLLPWGKPRWLWLRPRAFTDPEPEEPTRASVWALRLLLFRFMFASGYVKLSYGDTAWSGLTALEWHYWTQPLPTPLAWHVHQLGRGFHEFSCVLMFVVELGAPWLMFFGWIGRTGFALATIGLMAGIAATGNYGFFEPLTMVLALPLLGRPGGRRSALTGEEQVGDGAGVGNRSSMRTEPFAPAVPAVSAAPEIVGRGGLAGRIGRILSGSVAAAAALLASMQFGEQLSEPRIRFEEETFFTRALDTAVDGVEAICTTNAGSDERQGNQGRQPRLAEVQAWIAPFRTLNTYGLFRVMTVLREEIVIEGSDDAEEWKAYEFPFKPGDPKRPPPWCVPHMPRLDWQMWFAALSRTAPPWFMTLLERLLEGEPSVLALLQENPFPDRPPKYVRAVLYDYRFATPERRAQTGEWWFRVERRLFARPISLR